MNKWIALAMWNSPEGSKMAAASSLKKKKKQDRNAFGKSCIGKGTLLIFCWGFEIWNKDFLIWQFSKSGIPPRGRKVSAMV